MDTSTDPIKMASSAHAGPSVTRISGGSRSGQEADWDGLNIGDGDDLWSDILGSARRQRAFGRKNVLVLSERHHGRSYLLSRLKGEDATNAQPQHRRRKMEAAGAGTSKSAVPNGVDGGGKALALGYEVMHVRDDGDEESVPPVSIYYPPSSTNGVLGAVPAALPPISLSDTVVMIVLDWSRPARMIPELLSWLRWIEGWTSSVGEEGIDSGVAGISMREKLQLHIQRYTEPPAQNSASNRSTVTADGTTASAPPPTSTYTYNTTSGPLLPLGPGTLTLNAHGVPIVVVCTKADQMDAAGEATAGIKGNAWEERCDWVQQVLRTVCLSYGAALFYTATTQPHTYTRIRQYLLHRLYTIPLPAQSDDSLVPADRSSVAPAPAPTQGQGQDSNHAATLANSRFPFPHRANVLDREAVVVPTGWDSWGKIKVLREGFEPQEMLDLLDESLRRKEGDAGEEDGRGLEGVWLGMIPELDQAKTTNPNTLTTHVEPEQSFLSRHFDTLAKDPNRDPRAAFRNPSATSSSTATTTQATLSAAVPAMNGTSAVGDGESRGSYGGVVGPLGSGGLALPGVEKAMADMEGQGAEDLKEKFARLGRKEPKTPGGVTSPGGTGGEAREGKAVPNEALHNFFQGLLATKSKSSKGSAPPTPGPTSAGAAKDTSTPPASASTDGTS